jgi:hypothetical protein
MPILESFASERGLRKLSNNDLATRSWSGDLKVSSWKVKRSNE